MKGIVFTEFLEMVEDVFSPEMADRIITESQLASDGAYTAVGTYPHDEILAMVGALSRLTGNDAETLVRAFGRHLFTRFVMLYPGFFTEVGGTFDFLGRIEDHVHKEVQKLYPDAELPTFTCRYPTPEVMVMKYESQRPFAALAEGLIEGAIEHWGEDIALTRSDAASGPVQAEFTLKLTV